MKNYSLEQVSESGGMMDEINVEQEPNFDEQIEDNIEKKEVKIETLADFIYALELSYDETEDHDLKQKIGHQIVKINLGLGVTKYTAENVKVETMDNGVLGLYYPGSHETAISEELLNDFETSSALIKHVLAHEEGHKKGIDDEGLNELALRGKLPATISFYISEQNKAKRTFYRLGVDKAITLYDVDHPEKLLYDYLEVELENKYKNNKKELAWMAEINHFNLKVIEVFHDLSDKLESGAPRFAEAVKDKKFKDKVEEILTNLVKKK